MADKKKKPRKKPDGRGQRPRDPNKLALWIVEQSTSHAMAEPKNESEPLPDCLQRARGQPVRWDSTKPKNFAAFRVVACARSSKLTPLRSARSLAVCTIRAGSFGFCFRTGSGDM